MFSLGANVTGVLTEGSAASQNTPGDWSGSVSYISPKKGYWIIVTNSDSLCLENASPTESDIVYSLHSGANLISFPSSLSVNVSDALPDEIESFVTGVLTEGSAASQDDLGDWSGSLSAFSGGKGYWVITTEGIIFSFNLTRLAE